MKHHVSLVSCPSAFFLVFFTLGALLSSDLDGIFFAFAMIFLIMYTVGLALKLNIDQDIDSLQDEFTDLENSDIPLIASRMPEVKKYISLVAAQPRLLTKSEAKAIKLAYAKHAAKKNNGS